MKRFLVLQAITFISIATIAMEHTAIEDTRMRGAITQQAFTKLNTILNYENKLISSSSKQKSRTILEELFNQVEDDFETLSSERFKDTLRHYKNTLLQLQQDPDFITFILTEKLFFENFYKSKVATYRYLYEAPLKNKINALRTKLFLSLCSTGFCFIILGAVALTILPSQYNGPFFLLIGPFFIMGGLLCISGGYSCSSNFCKRKIEKFYLQPEAADYLKKLSYIVNSYTYDPQQAIIDTENQAE